MADLSEFEPVTVGRRVYVPLLVLDVDGRRAELRVPDPTRPPRNSRAVKPYACQECAAMVIDPAGAVVYNGAIDDKRSANVADIPGARNHLKAAIEEVMAGKPVSQPVTTPYGCTIKY